MYAQYLMVPIVTQGFTRGLALHLRYASIDPSTWGAKKCTKRFISRGYVTVIRMKRMVIKQRICIVKDQPGRAEHVEQAGPSLLRRNMMEPSGS